MIVIRDDITKKKKKIMTQYAEKKKQGASYLKILCRAGEPTSNLVRGVEDFRGRKRGALCIWSINIFWEGGLSHFWVWSWVWCWGA